MHIHYDSLVTKIFKYLSSSGPPEVWTQLPLDASMISDGTVATARLGSGTANSTTFLRGDNTWASTATQAFPIGSIFIAVVSTNPATLLGYGTWSAFGAGRVLVGLDSGDTNFDTVEETGGEKTHTLSAAEMPVHSHTVPLGAGVGGYNTTNNNTYNPNTTTCFNTGNAGSGYAHNNLQPYIVVYMWKRTA